MYLAVSHPQRHRAQPAPVPAGMAQGDDFKPWISCRRDEGGKTKLLQHSWFTQRSEKVNRDTRKGLNKLKKKQNKKRHTPPNKQTKNTHRRKKVKAGDWEGVSVAAIALLVRAALEIKSLTKQLENCASSWIYIWKCTLGINQILCIF